jgi:molybdopterin-guanine dinucleotide biosynthesis protein A
MRGDDPSTVDRGGSGTGEVTGVVLAGGESSRFRDGHKALATLEGEYLLDRVLDAVTAATMADPIVSVGDGNKRDVLSPVLSNQSVRVTFDDPTFSGPLAGLFGALDSIETPWLFLCGCDMPRLSPDAIQYLIDRRDAEAIVPVTDGKPEPLHALYRRSSLVEVTGDVSPEAGVHSLLDHLATTARVPFDRALERTDLEASTTNVNTLAELERIR